MVLLAGYWKVKPPYWLDYGIQEIGWLDCSDRSRQCKVWHDRFAIGIEHISSLEPRIRRKHTYGRKDGIRRKLSCRSTRRILQSGKPRRNIITISSSYLYSGDVLSTKRCAEILFYLRIIQHLDDDLEQIKKNHLCTSCDWIFTDEAFLHARRADRAASDMATGSEKGITLQIRANHAFFYYF